MPEPGAVDPLDPDDLFARILSLPAGPAIPWFLDVDGVLNLEGRMPGLPGSPQDWPEYRYERVALSAGHQVLFTWAPALVDCLNLLVEQGQVQVRWLTSWGLDAPLCAAPVIGLRVGMQVETGADGPAGTETDVWWKWQVVRDVAASGIHCIWTDDYLNEELGADEVSRLTRGRVLALSPDTRRGLTPRHVRLLVDGIRCLRGRR